MKKYVFGALFALFLLTGCDVPTFESDPELKESERIAVLEKAKTDTTSIIIKMDDKYYVVENNTIKESAPVINDRAGLGAGLTIAIIAFLLLIVAIIID